MLAVVALVAAAERRFDDAFRLLFLAVCIDVVDGTLARRLDVATHWPLIDGERLDALIDLMTMAVVPTFIALVAGALPQPAFLWVGVMVVASLVRFSRRGSKSDCGTFHYLPSCWYAVVFYAVQLRLSPAIVGCCIAAVVVAMFTRGQYAHPTLHPTRVQHIAIGVPALLLVAGVLFGQLPAWPWLVVSLTYVGFYVAQASWLTLCDVARNGAPTSRLRRITATIIRNYPRPSYTP